MRLIDLYACHYFSLPSEIWYELRLLSALTALYFAISTPLVAPVSNTQSQLWRYNNKRDAQSKLTKRLLDVTVDGELTGSQTTNHDQSCRKTSEGTTKAQFAGNLDQTRGSALTRQALSLVDL